MIDMTDVERLRDPRRSFTGGNDFLGHIADRLDAMQWSDEPPNTEGWWAFKERSGATGAWYFHLGDDIPGTVSDIRCDRWLKLPS